VYLSTQNKFARPKMRIHFYAIFVGVFLLTSCDSENKMKVTIESRVSLDQVPSASGIEFINNKFWVIGDNSPWLFEFNDKLILLNKYQIFSIDSMEGETIPKKNKHDYEAMTSLLWEGDSAMFIFGSGSKSPDRNSGKLIQFGATKRVTNFDLTKLYELIRIESKLEEDEFNLEAAAVLGENIFLFNRGKNKLISLKINDLSLFLKGEKDKVKLKVITIDLPNIDGIQAGFSGAFGDEKYNRMIFTASVENTANWIDDGAILGSFVGIINIDELYNHFEPICQLLKNKQNDILPIKVESITQKYLDKDKLSCIIVTDSDGHSSELLELEIRID
jgi:hypothetical protein